MENEVCPAADIWEAAGDSPLSSFWIALVTRCLHTCAISSLVSLDARLGSPLFTGACLLPVFRRSFLAPGALRVWHVVCRSKHGHVVTNTQNTSTDGFFCWVGVCA